MKNISVGSSIFNEQEDGYVYFFRFHRGIFFSGIIFFMVRNGENIKGWKKKNPSERDKKSPERYGSGLPLCKM